MTEAYGKLRSIRCIQLTLFEEYSLPIYLFETLTLAHINERRSFFGKLIFTNT